MNSFPLTAASNIGSTVGETDMIADSKRKPHQGDVDPDKLKRRRRQEEALDDALANTFPASDPVSVEQPVAPSHAKEHIR